MTTLNWVRKQLLFASKAEDWKELFARLHVIDQRLELSPPDGKNEEVVKALDELSDEIGVTHETVEGEVE